MIQQLMPSDFLERLLNVLLPEGALSQRKAFELKNIYAIVNAVINNFGQDTTIEAIFDSFYTLKYPMSVIEPLRGQVLKPYVTTNSHVIYIGIDKHSLENLIEYYRVLLTKKATYRPYINKHQATS